MDMVRMAIEAMYEDTCTVVEHRKTKEKGVVTYTDTVVLEISRASCRLRRSHRQKRPMRHRR